jgi:hypothetical protein
MIVEAVGLLEREKVIGSALHHAKLRRVVLLRGKQGSGKTELLRAIGSKLCEKSKIPPIIIYSCNPYKPMLLDILYQMYRRELLHPDKQEEEWEELEKQYSRGHSRNALTTIYETIEAYPEVVLLIDNIDSATKQGHYLFRHLLDHHQPPRIIATTTALARVDYLTWQGEILDIEPLSKTAVSKIVDHFVKVEGMKVQSLKAFRSQIFNTSAGNPLAIRDLIKYCRYEPVVHRHLLTGRDRSSGRVEMDMSFLIIVLFVGSMMSRYIARSVGDTHLYMMASIAAALTIGGRFILFKGGNKAE